jgi:hypothetical protein
VAGGKMTTIKTDTVITISLKEYAELKTLKFAMRELREDLKDWSSSMNFSTQDPTKLLSYEKVSKLLDGEK